MLSYFVDMALGDAEVAAGGRGAGTASGHCGIAMGQTIVPAGPLPARRTVILSGRSPHETARKPLPWTPPSDILDVVAVGLRAARPGAGEVGIQWNTDCKTPAVSNPSRLAP